MKPWPDEKEKARMVAAMNFDIAEHEKRGERAADRIAAFERNGYVYEGVTFTAQLVTAKAGRREAS